METETKIMQPNVVFANLAAVLRCGMYQQEMFPAVQEAIRFCEEVAATEAAKAEGAN